MNTDLKLEYGIIVPGEILLQSLNGHCGLQPLCAVRWYSSLSHETFLRNPDSEIALGVC